MDNLVLGFSAAMTVENLFYALLGCVLGTLVGVLPGLGPVATIAMLLPMTYILPPLSGLIMLSGIYYGTQYGGSTTAILVKIPGEASSIVTVLDGHAMAQNGRAGAALSLAAVGSLIAGCATTMLIAGFAPSLAELAFAFGPAEYVSLMALGLIGTVVLASGSVPKAICMILLGLLLGTVGTDTKSGAVRFDFGILELQDGIDFVIAAMGLYGLAEIMKNLELKDSRVDAVSKIGSLYPSKQEAREAAPAILRGTMLGSVLGILPGGGAILSSFASYALEKKLSKEPERFGKGHPAGLAGPESANNAGAQASFIPLLTLGIPGNGVMALMFGAMLIHGIQPGPQVVTGHPQLFWGLIASMWIANLMLVLLNLPLVGVWVKLLKVPYSILSPAILFFCTIGVYSLSYNVVDIFIFAAFGVLGYVWIKLGCEGAPLLLGMVLGPVMEENLQRALLLSRGDFSTFVTRPLSAALLGLAAFLLLLIALPAFRNKRQEAFVEAE